ncbi:hypothetical protein H6P81_006161 [Aristolochia fimbriata]|uniref:NusG-like N-terminal domain-containing protein n=1 Tax=Aristolochia fimbriata TaxID=158543 RepID=A0AAV7F0F7_ARIFI|nr:hypothetical protein H6P81_006161 [Aristolochia fimbriata]
MKQAGLLSWSPSSSSPLSLPLPSPSFLRISGRKTLICATLDSVNGGGLTARERRQLRSERRESKATNWKEEVEERLLQKPKKKKTSWTEELNLDNLALLGPQWWVVRVSRVSGQATAEVLAKSLVREFPEMEFKVYVPSVQVKKKLKNGTFSEKLNPLFPGCVFLWCELNKTIHDFVRECNGVGGFLGSRVGNTKRQINRPKPIATEEMEAIFRQAKEEQEKVENAFQEEHQAAGVFDGTDSNIPEESDYKYSNLRNDVKPRRRTTERGSQPSQNGMNAMEDHRSLIPGSRVRILSGPFAEFTGCLKGLNYKTGTATVGFMLLGKETLTDFDIKEIIAVAD